jgi:outer membrane protein assembly factor BamB
MPQARGGARRPALPYPLKEPMAQSRFIYLGVRGSVIALNSANGEQLWATPLKGIEFVNVVLDGSNLYAATKGEIFCLEPKTGIIRWHNPLKGYGWGLISIAGEGIAQNLSALGAEKRRRDEQDAASGSAAAGGSTAAASS